MSKATIDISEGFPYNGGSVVTPVSGYTVRPVNPHETAAVLDVIAAANPHLSARIDHFRSAGSHWWDAVQIAAYEQEKILSTAVVFRRSVWTAMGTCRFGGIGAVATRPELRGCGLASAVVEKCEAVLREQGFATAILFCTIPEFYARLGWRVVEETPLPCTGLASGTASVVIRRIDIKCEYMDLSDIYKQARTGAVLRPEGLWREYFAWQREDPSLLLGAYDRTRLIAYARARCWPDGLELMEATAAPGWEPAFGPLLRAQMELAGASQITSRSVCMMIKNLGHPQESTKNEDLWLDPSSFVDGLPWAPRIWWPVDRF